MMMPFFRMLAVSALAALAVLGTSGCGKRGAEAERRLEFKDFVPLYNNYIRNWLQARQEETASRIAELQKDIAAADGEERELLELQLEQARRDAEKWEFRLGLGDYLKSATLDDLPDGLIWQDGMDQPEIGDPRAKKGGVFRRYIPAFPPTIRPFGENANNSFRGDLYDYIDMPLVNFHPEAIQPIPGVANQWAVSEDGRTLYCRIDPEATYSDGVPVRAIDYQVRLYLMASDNIVNPYAKQYFREELAQIAVYDERTLSISLPEAKLYAAYIAGSMYPAAPHFYEEYGPDYSERYQWRFPPTTGAYEVLEDGIVKGASITQTRVKDWWARDRKYYRHRFNPDKLVHQVVRDESKAFELFRAGEHDTFLITSPEFWYEKTEMPPVHDGYIERTTFYKRYPKIPRGLYLNVTKPPLDNLDVRIGIHHSMNWRKLNEIMFRGDYERLNALNEGYMLFSDPEIRARPYSVRLAREAFARAGYTREGRDGILVNENGQRLSVSVSYAAIPLSDRIFSFLREEARHCGFELRLDGGEATVIFLKTTQKQHEMAFTGWMIEPIQPDFYQMIHSSTAFDEKGNPKPHTNNLNVWARPDTDRLCIQHRNARTIEELRESHRELQWIIHNEAIFNPAYSVDFIRIGSWRWVRWPDSDTTKFSPPLLYDPHESFVYWVDEELKEETLAARRAGTTFPEVKRIVDAYRLPPPGAPADEPEPPADEEAAGDE
ncbi:MAG TPA: ABC transporter substrate-binding protein [Luteolibacter sp.]|nr:ABC transporter substrate-binding protein [Luteolibacter sp.]